MNGKMRVSIVATALNGSEVKPYLNLVNTHKNNFSSGTRGSNFGENLFNSNHIEKNVVSSIDGATALKLDESFEIKNSEEQNALIDSFEMNEENQISEETSVENRSAEDIPTGVSIESASYIENNTEDKIENTSNQNNTTFEKIEEEHTPKLFSEDNKLEINDSKNLKEDSETEQLFDQDINEDEDFEIPAFLRRQKF